jgi:hypothetical protein
MVLSLRSERLRNSARASLKKAGDLTVDPSGLPISSNDLTGKVTDGEAIPIELVEQIVARIAAHRFACLRGLRRRT